VGGKEEKARACVLRMMMMRRPGLLAKARATKASSIEARQHSGADTIVECTHALQGTRRREGIQKTREHRFFSSPVIAAAASRRQRQDAVLKGGSSMRPSTKKAISMNTRNRRISRLTL